MVMARLQACDRLMGKIFGGEEAPPELSVTRARRSRTGVV